jgi:hypothetical protein
MSTKSIEAALALLGRTRVDDVGEADHILRAARDEVEALKKGETRTLRDWFAGQALAGTASRDEDFRIIARDCYAQSDAMLAAREGGK